MYVLKLLLLMQYQALLHTGKTGKLALLFNNILLSPLPTASTDINKESLAYASGETRNVYMPRLRHRIDRGGCL